MRDGALHYQVIPGWAHALPQAYAKCIDPPGENPFQPTTRVIGRNYMDDNASNALVMMGEAGAEIWFAKFKDQYARCKYLWAIEGPNEPPVGTLQQRQMLTRFTIRLGQLVHSINQRFVAFNWSVWWPDLGTAMDFASALPYVDYIGVHEYGYPRMSTDQPGRKCLHYRNTVAEWRAGGVTSIPPIFITECGEDDGQHHGWKTFAKDEPTYLADLQWYASELAKDDIVHAWFVFTAGNQGWPDFDITESLARQIVSAEVVVIPPVPVPVPDFFVPLRASFGAKCTDLRQSLLTNGTYNVRLLSVVKRYVIHHTAATHVPNIWDVAAKWHVNNNKWPGIGYHIGINPDGTVYLLNSLDRASYHCGTLSTPEDDNLYTIGICLSGNFEETKPTDARLAALRQLLPVIDAYLPAVTPVRTAIGHKDIAPLKNETLCPGKNMYPLVATIRKPVVARDPLPEDETATDAKTLAQKNRYWQEEQCRQREAKNVVRADAIMYSLVKLGYRLEAAIV